MKWRFYNPGINISYDGHNDYLKQEAEYKLGYNGINIWKKSIYHGPTKKQFYTHNKMDSCNLG